METFPGLSRPMQKHASSRNQGVSWRVFLIENMRLLTDIFGQTLRTLWAHKLRSFLTMFGIAWGDHLFLARQDCGDFCGDYSCIPASLATTPSISTQQLNRLCRKGLQGFLPSDQSVSKSLVLGFQDRPFQPLTHLSASRILAVQRVIQPGGEECARMPLFGRLSSDQGFRQPAPRRRG